MVHGLLRFWVLNGTIERVSPRYHRANDDGDALRERQRSAAHQGKIPAEDQSEHLGTLCHRTARHPRIAKLLRVFDASSNQPDLLHRLFALPRNAKPAFAAHFALLPFLHRAPAAFLLHDRQ